MTTLYASLRLRPTLTIRSMYGPGAWKSALARPLPPNAKPIFLIFARLKLMCAF
jgi:hypothetical protein